MRVTIVGTGAMACLFGAHFATVAPKAVTLVGTWAEGLSAINSEGIVLTDAHGTHIYPVLAVRLGEPVKAAEIVLVLVKAWQTELVAPYLAELVTPEGIILTLQNGLGNMEKLGPQAQLGVTLNSAALLRPGHVRAGEDGSTYLAAPPWAVEVFDHAGFSVAQADSEQVAGWQWGRLVVNCGIQALTALLRTPNGELLNRPDAALMMDRAAVECAMVAWAQGIQLPFNEPIAYVRQIAERTALNQSSMLQDVRRGAPTEIDAFNGAVMREGYRLGITTAVNEMLWRLVRALTASRTGR